MKTTAIIASHARTAITKKNIEILLSHCLGVVLILSDESEVSFFNNLPISIILHSNIPLGKKWQAGVNYARILKAEKIMIVGSDDILSKDFLQNINSIPRDFIGLRSWYVFHKQKLYECEYVAQGNLPLGSGRIYTAYLLNQINWQIFDIGARKLLDDKGWNIAKNHAFHLITTPEILAVKGDWSVMNPLNLMHKNIMVKRTHLGKEAKNIMKEKFDFVP